MSLYIRLENGQPIDHPLVESNLLQAFPGIDLNNLPSNFVKFNRAAPPIPSAYERTPEATYQLVGNEVYEVWITHPMTSEEILEKQNLVKSQWAIDFPSSNWIFDEATCEFVPPIPYPSDDLTLYRWSELNQNWVLRSSN